MAEFSTATRKAGFVCFFCRDAIKLGDPECVGSAELADAGAWRTRYRDAVSRMTADGFSVELSSADDLAYPVRSCDLCGDYLVALRGGVDVGGGLCAVDFVRVER